MNATTGTRRRRAIGAVALAAALCCGLVSCASAGPAAGTSPRGTTMPTATGGWTRLFQEDFGTDAALGSFNRVYPGWSAYDGSGDTSHTVGRPASSQGIWESATTTTVHAGMFDCRVHTSGTRPQVCALTPTPNGSWWTGQRYGRYTVRYYADPVPGYKVAFLLWPSTNRWSDGEIDFPEGDLDGTATASAHQIGDPQNNAFIHDTGIAIRGWHTASIAWSPAGITFGMDGRTWTTTDSRGIPTLPMRWALQVETSLSATPPPASASGHVLIDWVTIDAWKG